MAVDFATQGRVNNFGLNTFKPLTFDLGSSLNTAGNASKVAEVSKGLDWFGNSGIIGGIGAGLGGVASLWGAYNSFTQGKKQLKEMKRQNDLLEKQYNTEVERYNKREAERDRANNYFQSMANDIYQKYYANYGNQTTDNKTQNTENEIQNTDGGLNQAPQQEQEKQLLVERE